MADTAQPLTDRLMARGEGLRTEQMADGGEVVRGADATRALRTLDARAMTLDHTIVVGDDFDARRPEDAALYAHERHHLTHSGGEAEGHGAHEAEEAAAREIEAFVLHRARSGPVEDALTISSTLPATEPPRAPDDPLKATWAALLASDRPRSAIVLDLAGEALAEIEAAEERRSARGER
jgi:hypothetical protein